MIKLMQKFLKRDFLIKYFSRGVKLSIQTLTEKLKPLVTDKHEFESRDRRKKQFLSFLYNQDSDARFKLDAF